MRTLTTIQGRVADVSDASLKAHFDSCSDQGFWLDIEAPEASDLELLTRILGFHPLSVEDIEHQNQRPKLEEYPGHVFVVMFAAERSHEELAMSEHHLYLSKHFVVTVHRAPTLVLERLRERLAARPELTRGRPGFFGYLVVDALVDALFPVLDQVDERVDELEARVISTPSPQDLAAITRLKHQVTDLRRVLVPQRDLFQRMVTYALEIDDRELSLHYRDVYDHMVRLYETVDSLRDLLSGVMDVYLSTVSNRLNTTMKTLTVIASLFLPLSFLTGFYGMNFALLTQVFETPLWAFWVGVGTMLGATGIQLALFRRRGWL